MKIRDFYIYCLMILIFASATQQLDAEIMEERLKLCLSSGTLVMRSLLRCFPPFLQGPCDEDQIFVATLDQTGQGECINLFCEDRQLLYPETGHCEEEEYSRVCQQRGVWLHRNLTGEVSCGCGQGWGLTSGGSCQPFYRQSTHCSPGTVLFPRSELATLLHATKTGENIPCDGMSVCSTSQCSEEVENFHKGLEEYDGNYDGRCVVDGEMGHCCPADQSGNLNSFYFNRMAMLRESRGMCLRNTCPPDLTPARDAAGSVGCYKMAAGVLDCAYQPVLQDGELTCPPDVVLLSISHKTVPCSRRYQWSPRRQKCLKTRNRASNRPRGG